jgi:hypothetical protein
MKRFISKRINILKVALVIFIFSLSFITMFNYSKVEAQSNCVFTDGDGLENVMRSAACECKENPSTCSTYYNIIDSICNESNSTVYDEQVCTKARLGAYEVDARNIFSRLNPLLIIQILFGLFLTVVFLYAVFKIILVAMKIGSAKGNDAEKKKEAFKELGYVALMLVLAFSAFSLSLLIPNFLGVTVNENLVADCDELAADGYDPSIVSRCRELNEQLNN